MQDKAALRLGGLPVALEDGLVHPAHVPEAVHQHHHREILRLLLADDGLGRILDSGAPRAAEFLLDLL